MKERQGIRSACKYSLETLRRIEQTLILAKKDEAEMVWAVYGIIITLVAHLLKTCQEVINAEKDEPTNAIDDIREIQKQFNAFIDQMVSPS
jgi:hypothetical protein